MIQVVDDVTLGVGALGNLTFEKGLYLYVGSAQKNLEQRIKRHRRKTKRLFWHIDYLLDCGKAKVTKALYKEADKQEECTVAKMLDGFGVRVDGFGCSDCTCKSHLFLIKSEEELFSDDKDWTPISM